MTINRFLTPFALVAGLAFTAAPALAQDRGGSRSEGHSRGRSYSSSGYRGGGVRVAPRIYSSRGYYGGGRSYFRPYYSFRPRVSLGLGIWLGYPVAYPDYYYDSAYGYADPYAADLYAYRGAAPSYDRYPSQAYPPSNDRAYGYPGYGSSGPQGYSAPRSAPSVGVQRGGQQSSGGVSFEITPEDADVFVDGRRIGAAGDFGPNSRPLDLSGGRHRIEVRASGYRTMTFDADVVPGQVIPVQGTLQR